MEIYIPKKEEEKVKHDNINESRNSHKSQKAKKTLRCLYCRLKGTRSTTIKCITCRQSVHKSCLDEVDPKTFICERCKTPVKEYVKKK